MSRRSSGAKAPTRAFRVWTFEQARTAVPYITSIVRSVREHTLEALSQRRRVDALKAAPGRPDRNAIIDLHETEREVSRTEDRATEAADELAALDILPIDPVAGLALVPFVHDDQLAWYVFDLFDTPPLRFWRFQTDPAETRRPITAAQHGVPTGALAT